MYVLMIIIVRRTMEKLNVDFTNVSSFGLILIKAGMANRRAKSLYDIRD